MGLEVREHLQLGATVTHSGGLPGFASNMRWLPGRGIGAIAVTNLTYAPMSVLTRDLLELLHDRGALSPAASAPAPALERAARELAALLSAWDPARAAGLFADNVAPDDSLDRRAAAAAALRERHGALKVDAVAPDRATRGDAHLAGERGRVRVEIELAPLAAMPVQRYVVTSILPPSAALLESAGRLAQLAAAPDPPVLAALLETTADVHGVAQQLAAAHTLFGRLTVGPVVECAGPDASGAERAILRWHGERGDLDVTLTLSAGRLRLDRLAPRPLP